MLKKTTFRLLGLFLPSGEGGRHLLSWTTHVEDEEEEEVKLRQTVSRTVCRCVGLQSGTCDQIFLFCLTIAGFLMSSTLSDERMDL
jgi:hypothetical protein